MEFGTVIAVQENGATGQTAPCHGGGVTYPGRPAATMPPSSRSL